MFHMFAGRADTKCLAVTNSHPAELLREATSVVKSLEEVSLLFLQKLCAWSSTIRRALRPNCDLLFPLISEFPGT
jgi:hypothetical protein